MDAILRAGVIAAVFIALLAGFAIQVQQSTIGPSGYGYGTSPEDLVVNMTDQTFQGKVALVTGSNSGIGWETAEVLASKGFHVIMMARTYSKAEEAISRMKARFKQSKLREPLLTPLACDLGSLAEIEAAAQSFEDLQLPLHLLINNAVERNSPASRTKEGFELQMGVNYFGHMHLTDLLMPALLGSTPSRVVLVTSTLHRLSSGTFFKLDDFEQRAANRLTAYADSKMALILAAQNWHSRHYTQGVSFYAVSPGFTDAHLEGDMVSLLRQQGPRSFVTSLALRRSPRLASSSIIYAALRAPLEYSGTYMENCNIKSPKNLRIMHEPKEMEHFGNDTVYLIDLKIRLDNEKNINNNNNNNNNKKASRTHTKNLS